MFARPNSFHSQVAYVTNDLDAAIALLKSEFDHPGFYVFTNAGTGSDDGGPQLKIGLARVGGVEVELIEPVGDTAPLFKDVLPKTEGLAIRFHHVCSRIKGTLADWEAHVASIDLERHKVVFQGTLDNIMRFMYTDERATLGHYVEHVWLAPEIYAQMVAATPTYPQPETRLA